ncbi:MAG: sensor histidine kinase [Betaproteobacteria bacterium]|nr:sensor histidine kinase [Betaproteobacteria bacterium]
MSDKRHPDLVATLATLVSAFAVTAFFIGDLILSRQNEINGARLRVDQFGIMLAEHASRTFEAVDILLREVAGDLSERKGDWETWTPPRGWEYISQRHSRTLPQLRDLAVFDRQGEQRFISTYFPAPRINVRDRPYFATLEGGAATAVFGPYVGRNSGRYTYALARRITGARGEFAGVAFAAIEPGYFHDFCWSNRLADDFEAVLVNAGGLVVASCRPTDLSRQSPLLGAAAADTLYGGRLRDWLPERGTASGNGLIASVTPVPDQPDLRIIAALPEATALAAWNKRLSQMGILAALLLLILFGSTILVRRYLHDMRAMTDELAHSHEDLARRVAEATAELSVQKEEAERANRAKSRFLAAASHDLRQPLHAMSLFAADLRRQVRSGNASGLPHLADQIVISTGQLGQLFDSLLDISRLDVSGISPEVCEFPLDPVLERLVASFRRSAADRSQALLLRPTDAWVRSDPQMLERMIGNLISNALRYTPPGGRILVAVRRRRNRLAIEVRDNGPGIAPEHQEAIFAEFYQVGNRAREEGQGLGLGLAIIDRLARALGIEVGLRSRPGHGTTFSLLVEEGSEAGAVLCRGIRAGNNPVVAFVGNGTDIAAAHDLAKSWKMPVQRYERPDAKLGSLAEGSVVVTGTADAADARRLCPAPVAVVALGAAGAEGIHGLPLPLRPARLRALLTQLQKELPKSMP